MAVHAILDLKSKEKDVAFKKAIPVLSYDGTLIGRLVPVGQWLLSDPEILINITHWRKKFDRLFPTRTFIDEKTTSRFINSSYIKDSNSIFFLIYTESDKLIGHIGLSKMNESLFELVNLIRGESGGCKDLIKFSELAVLKYAFKVSRNKECFVELMSYNWPVKELHNEIGFNLFESHSLQKEKTEQGVFHTIVPEHMANVRYKIEVHKISRDAFVEYNCN